MVMHIDGTTIPNTPAAPEYLRVSAYLPPSFIASQPASHGSIAQIVQMFVESVGVPTVNQWRLNANLRGWPLTQQGPGANPNPPSPTLIPAPRDPDSAHYKFMGRPVGVLDTLLTPPTAAAAVPVVIIPDDDLDDATMDLMDAIERAAYAEAEVQEHIQRIHELESQVDVLANQVTFLEEKTTDLESQLAQHNGRRKSFRTCFSALTTFSQHILRGLRVPSGLPLPSVTPSARRHLALPLVRLHPHRVGRHPIHEHRFPPVLTAPRMIRVPP